MLITECVIVGGGLAGAATAFELARRGLRDVVVLEQEPTAGFHSSGRNAAMIRQVVPDPGLAALARESARRIGTLAEEWERPEIFRRTGSLLLAGDQRSHGLLRDAGIARDAGLPLETWAPADVEERLPATRGGRFRAAVHTPADGTVDVHALLGGFLAGARRRGCRWFPSTQVRSIRVDSRGRVAGVQAGDLEISTPRVVNAAGAWAARVGALAGAAPLPVAPYRRHLIHTGPEPAARGGDPFVWDVEGGVYFRPESGGLLVCPCDHTPSEPGDAQADPEALELLAGKLPRVFPALGSIRVRNYWAGHRTFASDERFVVGPDPVVAGFYWVAGLGGHGVTTSAAVGALAAETILDPARDRTNPFSPSRFEEA